MRLARLRRRLLSSKLGGRSGRLCRLYSSGTCCSERALEAALGHNPCEKFSLSFLVGRRQLLNRDPPSTIVRDMQSEARMNGSLLVQCIVKHELVPMRRLPRRCKARRILFLLRARLRKRSDPSHDPSSHEQDRNDRPNDSPTLR